MGLFSRKTIISVASVIYPLGDEPADVVDIVKAAVVTSRVKNTSVSTAIQASILDGIGVKISQAYNYAMSRYYAGMPTALPQTLLSKNDRTLEILCEEYLARLHSPAVVDVVQTTINYDNDYETVVRGLIYTEYHYDFYDDEVFTASGSIQVNASLVLTGPFIDTAHPAQIGYHLVFTNPDTSTVTIDKWYADSLFTAAKIVAQRVFMEYTLDAGPHQTASYTFGGTDARINIFLRDLKDPVSGTFPAMVLKRDNIYLDNNAFSGGAWRTSEEYQTTKTYAQRLNISVDDILARVKDNPDEDDIDYAFIQPGTLINATNQAMVKYHFNYFNNLRLNMPDSKAAYDAWVAAYAYPTHPNVKRNQAENMPSQSVKLADQDNPDSSVNMEIAWRYISYEVKTGVIDGYEVECGSQELTLSRWSSHAANTVEYDTTKLFLRKALSPTTYAEICICGLWHENFVYKGHSVQSAVWDAFNDPEGDYGTGFLIPLDYNIFLSLSPRERLQLGQEAFHMVFNCYVAKKQKWYQTGIFKVLLAIVAIVITYFSWGTATGWVTSLYTTLTTGVGAISSLAAILTIGGILVTSFVGISFVAKEAGKWAADHWGAFWGALVQMGAVILLTWGLGSYLGSPSFSAMTLTEQVFQTSSYILMGMSAYTQYQYVDFYKVQQEWKDYVAGPNDALEQITGQLEEMFPDLTFAQKAILPHPETLDEFMGRTLTTTEGLTGRLLMPIYNMVELTLTPRLI